ncbi:MAG: hypothetical protein AAGA37_07610 [Actinomycetota bacterium]
MPDQEGEEREAIVDGDQLFDLVEQYHRLGDHRAGSDADAATCAWYTRELVERGLRVRHEPVAFDRYVFHSELTAGGEALPHIPLFYEWTGSIDTTNVGVVAADANAGGRDDDLRDALDATRDALVIATKHPAGSLVAVNRTPIDHRGTPTVLIAGRDFDRARSASDLRLRLAASLQPTSTSNLIATNAAADHQPPLLLTTPLTGWFGCAGERGTGAAILLELVERCADLPLLVLATGGHELDYHGVRAWVGKNPAPPRAIVHVGASVAVDAETQAGERALIRERLAMTNANPAAIDAIGTALEPAGFGYRPGTERWLGESEVFCELDVAMLSFTGSGIDFHTPEDTPSRATSPPALAVVADAIADAVDALWLSTH